MAVHKGAAFHRVAGNRAAVGLGVNRAPGVDGLVELVDHLLPHRLGDGLVDIPAGLGLANTVRQVLRQGVGVVFEIVVQLRVGAHLVHHQLRAWDLQQGFDGSVALVPRAAVHALHHVHHLPVVVPQVHHVAQLFGGAPWRV